LTILFERVLYAWRRLYVIRGAMFVFVRLVSRGSERGAKRRIVRAIASFLVDRAYRVVGTHVRAAALDKLIHELARARGLNNARLRAGKSHNQITETLNRSLHGRRRGRNAMDATGGARA
jgi:hypothetical protein